MSAPEPGVVPPLPDEDGWHGPPVNAAGRVPGLDVGPDEVTPPPADLDRLRVYLDADGSGLFPSLYLVEVRAGDVVTYTLSRDNLPDFAGMTWRTRAALRAYCDRLLNALARHDHPTVHPSTGLTPDALRRPRG